MSQKFPFGMILLTQHCARKNIFLVSGTPSDNTSKTNAYYYLMATLTLEVLLDEGSRYVLSVPCPDRTVNPNISLSGKYARFRTSLHKKI